jgi:hypothetical protein
MVFVEEGDRVDANAVDASVDSAAAMSELPRHHPTAAAVQEDQVGDGPGDVVSKREKT